MKKKAHIQECFAMLTVWLFVALATEAKGQTSREYQLKAVFLYNFSRYTEWPAETFAGAQSPLTIGVLGKDPFGSALDDAVRGEMVNGRPLKVERFRRVEDVKNVQILFVSDSEAKHLPKILAQFRSQSILTVSEIEDFAMKGGMIRFITVNKKVHLRINLDAVKAARLTISSKLLRAAEVLDSPEK